MLCSVLSVPVGECIKGAFIHYQDWFDAPGYRVLSWDGEEEGAGVGVGIFSYVCIGCCSLDPIPGEA